MSNINTKLESSNKTARVLPWVICGLAAAFYCYEYLLRITPGLMVEQLQVAFVPVNALALDATHIGHLSAFYYYAYTPMQLPVGLMMDRYGPRNILTLAVLSCAIGTLIFASTTVFWIAAAGRFLIGFGSAFAFVGVLKLAASWLPANRFAFVSGLATTLGMVGAMFGEGYLTLMIDKMGWRETLNYSSYVGFALFPLVWLIIRDAPPETLHLNNVSEDSVKNSSYKQLFLDIYVALKNSQIWINGLIGCLIMAPTVVFAELWGVSYFKVVQNFSAEQSTIAVSMIFLGWAVGGPLAGYVSDKMGRRKPLLFVGSFVISILLLITIFCTGLSYAQICWLLFFIGFFSSVEIICFAIGRENCQLRLAGTVVAVTNFIVVCGAAFQVITGKILDSTWDNTTVDMVKVYSADNYRSAMLLLPILTILAFVTCFFLKETYCQQVVDENA